VQLIGTTASAPPVDARVERLATTVAAAASSGNDNKTIGVLAVQAGCHQWDHSYLNDVLMAPPSGLRVAGCCLADPSRGAEAGVAALRELAALQRGGNGAATTTSRNRLYRAVRFNPYLWPAHAEAPGVGRSADAAADADDRRVSGPTGRALFQAAGELDLAACFMPFKGLAGVAADIERLMDSSPQTRVVIDHYGFCAASRGRELLVGRGEGEWAVLERWSRERPGQVFVKASAAMRSSRQGFPHADASLYGLRWLVDAFGADRVMFGSDWPWVEDEGTFEAGAAAAAAAAAGDAVAAAAAAASAAGDWRPYGYEGAWRLSTDAASSGAAGDGFFFVSEEEEKGGGWKQRPMPAAKPLTEEEEAWVYGGTARALFPGAWEEEEEGGDGV
jgi:predicted TIM-barrel fold metal-dependent hydrolase